MKAYAEQVIKLRRMQLQIKQDEDYAQTLLKEEKESNERKIKKDEEFAQKIAQEEKESNERKIRTDEELAKKIQQEEDQFAKGKDRKVGEVADEKLASVLILNEKKEADRRQQEEEESFQLAQRLAAAEERAAKINAMLHSTQGTEFLKYGRLGKPHVRRVRVIANRPNPQLRKSDGNGINRVKSDISLSSALGKLDWSTGNLPLDTVISIEVGKKTKVFSRALNVSDTLCFSIICKTRTLDLQASTTQIRDDWVFGLNNILLTAQQQHPSLPKQFSTSLVRSSAPLQASSSPNLSSSQFRPGSKNPK